MGLRWLCLPQRPWAFLGAVTPWDFMVVSLGKGLAVFYEGRKHVDACGPVTELEKKEERTHIPASCSLEHPRD